MLKPLFLITLAVSGLSACDSHNYGDVNSTTPPAGTDNKFDTLRNTAQSEMSANASAAVSVAIYQDGEIVFAEAFGNSQWNAGTPVNTDTLFQLGSTTKMFTSLAIMQLVDQGIITTEDTLTSTLPAITYPAEQAPGWADINIHHMMTHQGGFLDTYETISDNSELTHYMLNDYGNANQQMVESGRFYNYSNPNFSYLGTIIEYFRQQDFRDFMKASVFEPLEMMRTTMKKSQVTADDNYALGVFQQNDGSDQGYDHINQVSELAPIIPAGNYTWSTPTELLKMADFLLNGDISILSDNLRAEMTKAQISTDFAGLPMNYGYGIYVDDGFSFNDLWYPEKLWQHGGNTDGYTSMFWILPEKNIAVAILSSGYLDDYAETMMAALEAVTELPAPEAMPLAEVDTSNFDSHAGIYDAGFFTIEVTNDNGELHIHVPELEAQDIAYNRTLYPIGANTFLTSTEDEEIDVTFISKNNDSESVYLRNRNFVGIKLGNELSERPAKAREMRYPTPARKIILE